MGWTVVKNRCNATITVAVNAMVVAIAISAPIFLERQGSDHSSKAWQIQFGSPKTDFPHTVACDNKNIYVTGATDGYLSNGASSSGRCFLSSYKTDGTFRWSKQFGFSTQEDGTSGAAEDSKGNIYIVGTTTGKLFSPVLGYSQVFLAKYSPEGSVLWGKQIQSSGESTSGGITVDARDNVFISGSTTDKNLHYHAFIAKFDSVGTLLLFKTLGRTGNSLSFATASDAVGSIYVVGQTEDLFSIGSHSLNGFLAKLSQTGEIIWGKQLSDYQYSAVNAVKTDGSGNIYIAGITRGGNAAADKHGFISKYSKDGQLVWNQPWVAPGSGISDLSLDDYGNVYAAGDTLGSLFGANSGDRDAVVAEYDNKGNLQWSKQWGTSESDSAVAVDYVYKEGLTIVGLTKGSLYDTNKGDFDGFLLHIDRP